MILKISVGGKFPARIYRGKTELVIAVLPRYYHGKTALKKKRGWFYHGITMVIPWF